MTCIIACIISMGVPHCPCEAAAALGCASFSCLNGTLYCAEWCLGRSVWPHGGSSSSYICCQPSRSFGLAGKSTTWTGCFSALRTLWRKLFLKAFTASYRVCLSSPSFRPICCEARRISFTVCSLGRWSPTLTQRAASRSSFSPQP